MMIHADSLRKCSLNKKRKTATNSTNIFHENLSNFKTLTENYFRVIKKLNIGRLSYIPSSISNLYFL